MARTGSRDTQGLEVVKVQQIGNYEHLVVLRENWWENPPLNLKGALRKKANYHINRDCNLQSHAEYVKMVTLEGDDYHVMRVWNSGHSPHREDRKKAKADA